MVETLVFLLAGGKGERLYPLTKDRAKPAVPFGGNYRIVDFPLSNCVNSGLRQIFMLTQYKSISLDRHIRLGWNILNPELGEYVTILPAQQRVSDDWYRGTADAIFQNIYTLEREKSKLVLILAGDHIYKMDYRPMIDFHKSRNAEITVAVMDIPISEAHRFGVLEIDRDNRIVSFEEKPKAPRAIPGLPSRALISMGIYLFQTEALVREVIADTKIKDSSHDFGRDILPRLIREGQPVCAFPFQDWQEGKEKYWRDVGTLEAYYEANMDLVSVTPQLDLYESTWPIRTYQPPLPPAKTVFRDPGRCGQVLDSLIGDGSIVSGAKVVHSIISSGVFIHSYSEIEDSVIMDGVEIGRHARIRRAIIDKHVRVPDGFRIGYDLDEDRKRFTVTDTGIVVVPERMVI
ncbi:MAG: glucose-1-phosphate adenylyltransferase [Candidatus Omnitrophota bacterium]|nr:glucose-1-phosphate adenylyltransferase [Candidatus Omnitrophota bacterium]